MSTIQNTKRKLKRKAKKFKLKAVMKNRFVLEGFYKYGDTDKSRFRRMFYLTSLHLSSKLGSVSGAKPRVYERKKYTIKPCVSAPESSFAKRPSPTLMAKKFLVNDIISLSLIHI